MKLLVVKTSSMGDVIHTFQAIEDVRRHRPDVALDWCVEEAFADIVALHPAVGTIHRVATRRWRRALLAGKTWSEAADLRCRLRAGAYDLVVDAQGLIKSALIARLAGAPVAGYDRASAREPAASIFYRNRFAVARGLHAIERTRRLFGLALGYAPDLADLSAGIAAPPLPPGIELPGRPAFLLHGTSRADKKWPTEEWVTTARLLLERGLTPLVTYSSADERAVAASIAAAVAGTKVIERSPLREIAALIGRCELVIGADTGLTHLASAFGLPTVAVFLSTAPGLTGPVGAWATTLSRREGRPVRAGDVVLEADRLLAARAQPKRTSTIS